MNWTKQHSQNAVAAKARRRMNPPGEIEEQARHYKVPVPRRRRARFTLQIRDHLHGDSLTLNLHPSPWPNLWRCEQGQFSTAHLAKTVRLILSGGV